MIYNLFFRSITTTIIVISMMTTPLVTSTGYALENKEESATKSERMQLQEEEVNKLIKDRQEVTQLFAQALDEYWEAELRGRDLKEKIATQLDEYSNRAEVAELKEYISKGKNVASSMQQNIFNKKSHNKIFDYYKNTKRYDDYFQKNEAYLYFSYINNKGLKVIPTSGLDAELASCADLKCKEVGISCNKENEKQSCSIDVAQNQLKNLISAKESECVLNCQKERDKESDKLKNKLPCKQDQSVCVTEKKDVENYTAMINGQFSENVNLQCWNKGRECSAKVLCTSDVFKCVDGSFVSRDPNNGCQFRPCGATKGITGDAIYDGEEYNKKNYDISQHSTSRKETTYDNGKLDSVTGAEYSITQLEKDQEELNKQINNKLKAINVAKKAASKALGLIKDPTKMQNADFILSLTGQDRFSQKNQNLEAIFGTTVLATTTVGSQNFQCKNVSGGDVRSISYYLFIAATALYVADQINQTQKYKMAMEKVKKADDGYKDEKKNYAKDQQVVSIRKATEESEVLLAISTDKYNSRLWYKEMIDEISLIAEDELLTKQLRIKSADYRIQTGNDLIYRADEAIKAWSASEEDHKNKKNNFAMLAAVILAAMSGALPPVYAALIGIYLMYMKKKAEEKKKEDTGKQYKEAAMRDKEIAQKMVEKAKAEYKKAVFHTHLDCDLSRQKTPFEGWSESALTASISGGTLNFDNDPVLKKQLDCISSFNYKIMEEKKITDPESYCAQNDTLKECTKGRESEKMSCQEKIKTLLGGGHDSAKVKEVSKDFIAQVKDHTTCMMQKDSNKTDTIETRRQKCDDLFMLDCKNMLGESEAKCKKRLSMLKDVRSTKEQSSDPNKGLALVEDSSEYRFYTNASEVSGSWMVRYFLVPENRSPYLKALSDMAQSMLNEQCGETSSDGKNTCTKLQEQLDKMKTLLKALEDNLADTTAQGIDTVPTTGTTPSDTTTGTGTTGGTDGGGGTSTDGVGGDFTLGTTNSSLTKSGVNTASTSASMTTKKNSLRSNTLTGRLNSAQGALNKNRAKILDRQNSLKKKIGILDDKNGSNKENEMSLAKSKKNQSGASSAQGFGLLDQSASGSSLNSNQLDGGNSTKAAGAGGDLGEYNLSTQTGENISSEFGRGYGSDGYDNDGQNTDQGSESLYGKMGDGEAAYRQALAKNHSKDAPKDEINESSVSSIFKVISNRYVRSAYPVLVQKRALKSE